ncbi:hypothetical protein Echvi_2175 [Echinicola vietnamensis DSM 17526]|uniref:Uncharacterized protein n=1 Tax=Echinicola vietnamensis (strain DSM 17526 / LMG 23754 / KMM 6221) TaxID=926556 RepID=L0G088_ECHVK|nr:hypothetical protein Echvi_2175 [Echinicola vietnamensis DSM 17526]
MVTFTLNTIKYYAFLLKTFDNYANALKIHF